MAITSWNHQGEFLHRANYRELRELGYLSERVLGVLHGVIERERERRELVSWFTSDLHFCSLSNCHLLRYTPVYSQPIYSRILACVPGLLGPDCVPKTTSPSRHTRSWASASVPLTGCIRRCACPPSPLCGSLSSTDDRYEGSGSGFLRASEDSGQSVFLRRRPGRRHKA